MDNQPNVDSQTQPNETSRRCTAFADRVRVATGELSQVAAEIKALKDAGDDRNILIFDDSTSAVIDVDFRGSEEEVLVRLLDRGTASSSDENAAATAKRSPGRPKLGVVGREVTLLPRHWTWLAAQPGGASVALRKLVDQARKANEGIDRLRRAQESAYRFMSAMAGDEPGFEEAARALFNGNASAFEQHTETWPIDVRRHARTLRARAAHDALDAS